MNEFVRHEIPKQYRTRFQNILNADSEVVNLHKEGPRYYALGLQVKLRLKFLLQNKLSIGEIFSFLNRQKNYVFWIILHSVHFQKNAVLAGKWLFWLCWWRGRDTAVRYSFKNADEANDLDRRSSVGRPLSNLKNW